MFIFVCHSQVGVRTTGYEKLMRTDCPRAGATLLPTALPVGSVRAGVALHPVHTRPVCGASRSVRTRTWHSYFHCARLVIGAGYGFTSVRSYMHNNVACNRPHA